MKKFIIVVAIFVLVATVFSGCSKDGDSDDIDNDSGKVKVVATIFPQYDFVREIAGDKVELTMMLPPGSESHSFEPTPKDIFEVEDSDIFIYIGGGSDPWADRILESMDTDTKTLLVMTDIIAMVEEELVNGMESGHVHDDEEDDHDHENEDAHEHDDDHDHTQPHLDEHIWTSPENAKRVVTAISDALCYADEENAEFYRQNAANYIEKLNVLDASFEEAVANGKRKTIVFADRFPFRYLADEYDLEYYAAFPGCSTETEASAATVAFLIDKVKEEEIPVVFHIEFSNEKMADTICESTGAKKLLLHSCHNLSKTDLENGENYLSLMEQNLENLKEALQ